LFISYAHGDDVAWVEAFTARLKTSLRARLGAPPAIWLDCDALHKDRDYRSEIPDSLDASALMLLFPSPTYLASAYCVLKECKGFESSIASKRERFDTPEFQNELFVFRCPILPISCNRHWNLFQGASDFNFFNRFGTLPNGHPEFEAPFVGLVERLFDILNRMRNRATPVFLYPLNPPPAIKAARESLVQELTAQSYRVLPEDYADPVSDLQKSSLSVFLLGSDSSGSDEDINSSMRELWKLTDTAKRENKPWVVWKSSSAAGAQSPTEKGTFQTIERVVSPSKTFFDQTISLAKLKEYVLATLRPDTHVSRPSDGKPRVYVIYDPQSDDGANAGIIPILSPESILFELYKDPTQHTKWLEQSDGVFLVWGTSGENWCSRQFEDMRRLGKTVKSRGICLFDPSEHKRDALEVIQKFDPAVHIAEQFGGGFDPLQLTTFFENLQ
jgi:hypothetical protein